MLLNPLGGLSVDVCDPRAVLLDIIPAGIEPGVVVVIGIRFVNGSMVKIEGDEVMDKDVTRIVMQECEMDSRASFSIRITLSLRCTEQSDVKWPEWMSRRSEDLW